MRTVASQKFVKNCCLLFYSNATTTTTEKNNDYPNIHCIYWNPSNNVTNITLKNWILYSMSQFNQLWSLYHCSFMAIYIQWMNNNWSASNGKDGNLKVMKKSIWSLVVSGSNSHVPTISPVIKAPFKCNLRDGLQRILSP